MAVDEELAGRVRRHLRERDPGREPDERRMFGGLAFLVGGHMAVCVASGGSLMVRCPREETERLRAEPGAGPMVMQGRELEGWVLVEAAALTDETTLGRWVERGASYAASLPPKAG